MKQDNNELQALENAVNNLNLQGHKVFPAQGYKAKYFLRDNEGNTLTGSWDYTRLNHFIMGYGKAFNKFNPSLSLPEETIKEQSSNRGEGDMKAKWYLIPTSFKPVGELRDMIIAEMDISVTNELKEENQQLMESNTRLKERIEVLTDALNTIITYHSDIESMPGHKLGNTIPFLKAKEALNNK